MLSMPVWSGGHRQAHSSAHAENAQNTCSYIFSEDPHVHNTYHAAFCSPLTSSELPPCWAGHARFSFLPLLDLWWIFSSLCCGVHDSFHHVFLCEVFACLILCFCLQCMRHFGKEFTADSAPLWAVLACILFPCRLRHGSVIEAEVCLTLQLERCALCDHSVFLQS